MAQGEHVVSGYEYEALAFPEQLRILVLGAADNLNDPLSGEIELRPAQRPEIHTSQLPAALQLQMGRYDALSWCWPRIDEKNKRPIKITDSSEIACNMEIPLELSLALVNLRHKDRKRYLWIDYICINQADKDERSTQVPRMSAIYGSANTVCIWLGDTDHVTDSDLAIRFIRKMNLEIYHFEDKLTDEHFASWKAIKNLMKRRWFHRRWVIQEVALAKQATLHCGRSSLPWDEFANLISLLVDNVGRRAAERLREMARKDHANRNEPGLFDEIPALGATTLVQATTRIQKKIADTDRSVSLPYLVATLAMFKNKEPRDTIYALLALARDVIPFAANEDTKSPTEVQKILAVQLKRTYVRRYPVDYKKPILDVYQQFLAYSIAHAADPARALDVILQPFAQSFSDLQDAESNPDNYIAGTGNKVDMPSWMRSDDEVTHEQYQDLSQQSEGSPYEMKRCFGEPFIGQPGGGSQHYNAAGTKRYNPVDLRFQKRRGHYSMYVEGFILDTITYAYEASQLCSIPAGWFEVLDPTPESGQDPDTLWRTLCANRMGNAAPPRYLKKLIEDGLRSHSRKIDFNTEQTINKAKSDIWARAFRQISDTIWARRLIKTADGYIGLAPREARVGDCVCILYGCSVPVILRRSSKELQEVKMEDEQDQAHKDTLLPSIEPLVTRLQRRWRIKHQKESANIFLRLSVRLGKRLTELITVWDERKDSDNATKIGAMSTLPRVATRAYGKSAAAVAAFAGRIIALSGLFLWVTHQMGQTLDARLLVLLVVPQTLIDVNSIMPWFTTPETMKARPDEGESTWASVMSLRAAATLVMTSSMALPLLAVLLGFGGENPATELGLITFLIILVYPELLPPRMLDAFERYLKSQNGPLLRAARQEMKEKRAVFDQEKHEMKLQWFKVIGESYIDNMMNGQAIEMQNNDHTKKHKYIKIELR